MSLDKLKTSWDSLNDSVDQKEIVTIKKMRKELYDSKYNRLKRKYIQEAFIFGLCIFAYPILKTIRDQETDTFTTYWILGGLIYIAIKLFTSYFSLKYIKMDDDIHTLKKKIHEFIRADKIALISIVITLPIIMATVFALSKLDNPMAILISFSLTTSGFNCYAFYDFYSTNKIFNSMLEDIKQLEELDMY